MNLSKTVLRTVLQNMYCMYKLFSTPYPLSRSLTTYIVRQLDSQDHIRIYLARLQFIHECPNQVVQPISVHGETTGSYRHGFRCDNSETRLWKRLVLNKQW